MGLTYPGFVRSPACPSSQFKCFGAHSAQMTVASCLIVERFDIVRNASGGQLRQSGLVPSQNLVAPTEAFPRNDRPDETDVLCRVDLFRMLTC